MMELLLHAVVVSRHIAHSSHTGRWPLVDRTYSRREKEFPEQTNILGIR